MDWKDKVVLITGGTGSFGKRCVSHLLERYPVRKVIVFSRDELKQVEMQQASSDQRLRFFLGDVRDKERLYRAFSEVDVVVHAAALKQVPAAEYNPFEVIKTNILGAQNVIECAIDRGVAKVIALSTDKAANPINLYGATKLCSDKLFVAGNAYVGAHPTRFSVVRYGNVIGSRGSVIPLFLASRRNGVLPITDIRMTRFWITLEKGVDFVLGCFSRMHGGEIFVPKIPSMRMADLARVIGPACRLEPIGIRPGEKLHEVMVTEDDARHTMELDDCFVILPLFGCPGASEWIRIGRRCPDGFRYGSDTNDRWLTEEELATMVAGLDIPEAREFAQERGISV